MHPSPRGGGDAWQVAGNTHGPGDWVKSGQDIDDHQKYIYRNPCQLKLEMTITRLVGLEIGTVRIG